MPTASPPIRRSLVRRRTSGNEGSRLSQPDGAVLHRGVGRQGEPCGSGRHLGAMDRRVYARRPTNTLMLGSVSPTDGDQQSTACDGCFGCACYHPLLLFNQFDDLERCVFRSGNVQSADN